MRLGLLSKLPWRTILWDFTSRVLSQKHGTWIVMLRCKCGQRRAPMPVFAPFNDATRAGLEKLIACPCVTIRLSEILTPEELEDTHREFAKGLAALKKKAASPDGQSGEASPDLASAEQDKSGTSGNERQSTSRGGEHD